MQRPALRALLDDVRRGKIDVVVAHRFDRISRSLFDLCDFVALLDVQRVQLVSVTQAVDTGTPWGRLSLHLLTGFAEFERQLIGERTRDKLAATRRSGRWQGQGTPLGYGVDFQHLIHQVVIDHLRERFRDPEDWMPELLMRLEGEPALDEIAIRRALKKLDDASPLFMEPTQGEVLFKLISRVTVYPDQVGIQVDKEGVVEMVRELDRRSASHMTAVAKQPRTRRARG